MKLSIGLILFLHTNYKKRKRQETTKEKVTEKPKSAKINSRKMIKIE